MAFWSGLFKGRGGPTTASTAWDWKKFWPSSSLPYTMLAPPTFGRWLRVTAVDLLTMAVLGALTLAGYINGPFGLKRRQSDAVVLSADDALEPILPSWVAIILATTIPTAAILLMQIRLRSFWDANNAILGLFYAVLIAMAFEVAMALLLGWVQPTFYGTFTLELPEMILASSGVSDSDGLRVHRQASTSGSEGHIVEALGSVQTDLTATAFAGFVYLSLYLNAKLKVFSNYHPAIWKLILVYTPILGACLMGASLTLDYSHSWFEVVADALIGTIIALSAYRMVFASIWDYRINHIPLNRSQPSKGTYLIEAPEYAVTKRATHMHWLPNGELGPDLNPHGAEAIDTRAGIGRTVGGHEAV